MLKKEHISWYLVLCLILNTIGAIAQQKTAWQIKPNTIVTRWAKEVDPDRPLPEYPRPQLERKNEWQNLNGLWEYAITTDTSHRGPVKYNGQILVPYPLESALSGVGKILMPEEVLWYRRTFESSRRKNEHTILHFGAIDWESEVFLNGISVGGHKGGYTGFKFDVTPLLKNGKNEITVRVKDPTNKGINPHGKQTLKPGSIYYTPTSGIWQTVWIENVNEVYIDKINIYPDVNNGLVRITLDFPGDDENLIATIEVVENGITISKVKGSANQQLVMKVPNHRLWSPENPFLYGLRVKILHNKSVVDNVQSYFGMRKVDVQKDPDGIDRIYLNDKPYFNLGTLDQGFWPEGVYTSPTDEALVFDIRAIKAMGFNTIRKHIKVEPDRWYYHADRIGMLVWQDFVNPPHDLPEGSTSQFETETRDIIEQLRNHPCVTTWVLFNEHWGMYDQKRLSDWVKSIDSTRILNGHSGEFLYVNNKMVKGTENPWNGSDIIDVHSYPGPIAVPLAAGKASVLGEFGGIGVVVENHEWDDLSGWGYIQAPASQLLIKYSRMMDSIQELRRVGLSGCIYTQPYDVEGEENGLYTYDRAIVKVPIAKIREVNSRLVPGKGDREELDISIKSNPDTIDIAEKYADYLSRYRAGQRDSSFLRRLVLLANEKKDNERIDEALTIYLSVIKDTFNLKNISLLKYVTFRASSYGFTLLIRNRNRVVEVFGEEPTKQYVQTLIDNEIRPIIFSDSTKPNFEDLNDSIVKKYGVDGEQVLLNLIALYYYYRKEMDLWYSIKVKIHEKYPSATSIFDMNNDAWMLFLNTSDTNRLKTALEWSRQVIEKEPIANYYDTYANILYRLGRTREAISVQEEALALDQGNESETDIKKNLDKMKKGLPTWK